MSIRAKVNLLLGWLAGALLSVSGKAKAKPTARALSRAEFKTSTQRLGVRFTEKIRKVFRFRWLRKH